MGNINKYFNWTFLGAICTSFFLLIIAFFIGKSEDKQFLVDQQEFSYAIQFIDEGEIESGIQLLNKLETDYQDNHLITWQKGWALGQLGQIDEAIDYFIEAQEQNPVLTRQPIFLIQFSWVMLNAERYEEAKVYLEHTLNQGGITEDQIELVNEWLTIIKLRLGTT